MQHPEPRAFKLPHRRRSATCLHVMSRSQRPILLTLALWPLTACGTGTLDMSGYPDAGHERLYRDGRLGGDDGLLSFDARKAWRAVSGTGTQD